MKVLSVHLSSVRHNDLSSYIRQGFGGRPLVEWPIYEYIQLYLAGDETASLNKWTKKINEIFVEFCDVPKKRGGNYMGTIHQKAADLSELPTKMALRDPKAIEESAVLESIEIFIREKFRIITSIADEGYVPNKKNPIRAEKKGELIVLKGGHHRAATLLALGHEYLPEVMVYQKIELRLFRYYKMFKKYINQSKKK